MRVQLKLGVASALDTLGVLERLRQWRRNLALVLTFHRVLPDAEIGSCYERHIAMCASTFKDLLNLLSTEYEVVPLLDLLERRSRGTAPRVALTFDDGWEDTCTVVAPMLASHGMPATVFLCPGLIGSTPGSMLPEERFARTWQAASQQARLPQLLRDLETWQVAKGLGSHLYPWARRLKHLPLDLKLMMLEHLEHIYSPAMPAERRFLTWDEARRMQTQGFTFGSHTARHASLNAEKPATMRRELLESRERIANETGEPCSTLAYPNGAYNRGVVAAAQQAGYRYAFTTDSAFVTDRTDPFTIPRLSMADPVVESPAGGLHRSRTRLYLGRFRFQQPVTLSGQRLGAARKESCSSCAASAEKASRSVAEMLGVPPQESASSPPASSFPAASAEPPAAS